ncbi:MAG: hypothetical protein ACE5GT_11940, partial [Rhodospirillales bacterium]
MKAPAVNTVLAGVALAAVTMISSAAIAETACPAFPKVAFWGELSHDSVGRHVETQLAGDWFAYVARLERQQKTLKDIYKRGSGAAIKRDNRKIRLSGDQLAKYLRYADQRLAVVRCLADESDITGLGNFSTAAGTPSDVPFSPVPKAAPDKGADTERTFMTLPKHVMEKLRKIAVRRSVKDAR